MINLKMGKAIITSRYRFTAVGITCFSIAFFCIGAELLSTTAKLKDSISFRESDPTINSFTNHSITEVSNVTFSTLQDDPMSGLPEWVANYISWHNEMRTKFPGSKLLTDPEAPNLIVRTPGCGGLADRLGQLPLDLYLANQTNRLLLIWWNKPAPLEEFLLPNQIDWTVPNPEGPEFEASLRVLRKTKPRSATRGILDNDCEWRDPDWSEKIDRVVERAKPGGELGDVKLLTHRIVGHSTEIALEKKLEALGETDTIHYTNTFGKIYNTFFRPSPGVQREIDISLRDMGLESGEAYSAIHMRVRHPRGIADNESKKKEIFAPNDASKSNADDGGLRWEGDAKFYALAQAARALQCTRHMLQDEKEKVYFYADSGELVRHMVYDIKRDNATQKHYAEIDAANAASILTLVGRNASESLHIHRQRGQDASHYYDTFVDLMIASKARCVSYGIGNFGLLASKIAGPACSLWYQQEAAGPSPEKGRYSAFCNDDFSIFYSNAEKGAYNA